MLKSFSHFLTGVGKKKKDVASSSNVTCILGFADKDVNLTPPGNTRIVSHGMFGHRLLYVGIVWCSNYIRRRSENLRMKEKERETR